MASFDIPPKEASNDQLAAWRKLTLMLNSHSRFRHTANLKKRQEADARKKQSAPIIATQATVRSVADSSSSKKNETKLKEKEEKEKRFGFRTYPEQLTSLTSAEILKSCGGLQGIAQQLNVSPNTGILDDELDLVKRREVYGSNMHLQTPPKRFFSFVWDAMNNTSTFLLIFFEVLSLIIELTTLHQRPVWYIYEEIPILLVLILLVFVEPMFHFQLFRQIRALEKEQKIVHIQVIRNGERKKISIYDIVVGDVVQLTIGDQVPGDGLYICGHSLNIIEPSMEGIEARKVDEEKPFILSGSVVEDGSGSMLITAVGMNTEWGRQMAKLGEKETPLEMKLNGVATRIGNIGLVFQIAGFLVTLIKFVVAKKGQKLGAQDAIEIVNIISIAVGTFVVARPEGLLLGVKVALAYATKKMLADNALVKRRAACETIASTSCICTHKTGVLTTNEMEVTKAWIGGNLKDVAKITEFGLHATVKELLFESILQNTSGDVQKENGKRAFLGTPIENALLRFGIALRGDFEKRPLESNLVCEPFVNSSRKRMDIVVKHFDGNIRAHWKGATEIVLDMCDNFMDCEGHIIEIDSKRRKELRHVVTSMGDQALRTLCLVMRNLDIEPSKHDSIDEEKFTCMAIVGIRNPVHPGIREAVETCRSAGIMVKMVTSDNIHIANAIAQECGILTNKEKSIEGPDFQQLPLDEQARRIPTLQVMAKAHPTDKYKLVTALCEMRQIVAVAARGINDAPFLHETDLAIAMGVSGTEIAKANADIVLLDDDFHTLVTAIKWGRSVYVNIQKLCHFQLIITIVTSVTSFTSAFSDNTLLNTPQLIWFSIIVDYLGVMALITEPPCEELMELPPLGHQDSFITKIMWRNIAFQVIYQLLVLSLLQYKGNDMFQLGDNNGILNTLLFNSFVFCQVFNEINSRDMERINVFKHLFSNWIFIANITFTILLQDILVQTEFTTFKTCLNGWQWLISVMIGFLSLPIAMIGKFVPEVGWQWLISIVIGFFEFPIAIKNKCVPKWLQRKKNTWRPKVIGFLKFPIAFINNCVPKWLQRKKNTRTSDSLV